MRIAGTDCAISFACLAQRLDAGKSDGHYVLIARPLFAAFAIGGLN